MKKDLIQELREMFEYSEGGYLIRKSTGRPCGQRVNEPNGRVRVRVGRRMMLAHRVIYIVVHGKLPEGEIDHLDQNPANNRVENLRDVSKSGNQHNRKMSKSNTSGFQGVNFHAPLRKWQARIQVNNRRISLGLYEDFDEAVLARKLAKIQYHSSSPEAIRLATELFPCGA